MPQPRRVLLAHFNHETNTFSKQPADREAFEARTWAVGAGMLSHFEGTASEIAGFLDGCRRHGWEAVPTIAADATPSGMVTREVFDTVVRHILDGIDRAGRLDAILLSLHGAMVVESTDDGEGTLVELIREKVGRSLPIGVTLDLHANCSDKLADLADVIVSYRTYPHVDHVETAARCVELIAGMLEEGKKPRCAIARGALIVGLDMGRTTAPGPMTKALALAREIEAREGVLSVSLNAGFPWADISYAGPTAIVVGEGDRSRLQAHADELGRLIWETRAQRTVELIGAAEAVKRAAAKGRRGAPAVIADYADNPGGGGFGDTTGLLRAMLEAKLPDAAFSPVYDPESVAACRAAGEGNEVSLRIGGKVDARFGAPIETRARVTKLFGGKIVREGPMLKGVTVDFGPAATVRAGGVDIVLMSRRFQNADRIFFKAGGIEPTERAVLGLKSMQHFRAAYAPIAGEILVVDEGGGCCSENFASLPYRNLRRPVYPLDLD
jgi:microcystin degradation protein MlrC